MMHDAGHLADRGGTFNLAACLSATGGAKRLPNVTATEKPPFSASVPTLAAGGG